MGSYVEFTAKVGCEDQINTAYRSYTGNAEDFLVYSASVIEREIAFIHSPEGESQRHLRSCLKTKEDWNKLFPVLAQGMGQLKVSGIKKDDKIRQQQAARTVSFLLEHRFLFKHISGLDDAYTYGFTAFSAAALENARPAERSVDPEPTFAELPRPAGKSRLYRLCVEYDRPDIWGKYLAFRDAPLEIHWQNLRECVIPWSPGAHTAWNAVEMLASLQDGRNFGLRGRFRDGQLPSVFLVRRALEIFASAPAEAHSQFPPPSTWQ